MMHCVLLTSLILLAQGADVEKGCASSIDTSLPEATGQAMLQIRAQEAPEATCELPDGARWCAARSGNKSWQMAVGQGYVSDTVCRTGGWEHTDPASMGVTSGDHLLDIGAQIGWYTFMFAQHGYNVLAVEPMTANRALINATMCRNPKLAAKITVVAAALTDKVKKPGQKCSILSANIDPGDGVLACNDAKIAKLQGTQHIEREQVPLTTLDEVLASSQLTRIDVMKMDVEGYECRVLAGASTLFTLFHPKGMMIETRDGKAQDGNNASTIHCTVQAVMKGGNYKIHSTSFAGPVIEEPSGDDLFNLYFSLEEQ